MNVFSPVQVFPRQIGYTYQCCDLAHSSELEKHRHMQKDPSQAGDTPEQNWQVAEQWKISFVFHS